MGADQAVLAVARRARAAGAITLLRYIGPLQEWGKNKDRVTVHICNYMNRACLYYRNTAARCNMQCGRTVIACGLTGFRQRTPPGRSGKEGRCPRAPRGSGRFE